MRICSLLPSATEIVADLGLVESLVGISEECDWPPEVRGLPVVTASGVETTRLTSLEIDRAVREAVGDGRPLYAIDRALLETLQPDLILTQNLCAVCAVSADNVSELWAADAEVVALDAHALAEIEERILLLADLLGVSARGRTVVAEMEAKIAAVRAPTPAPSSGDRSLTVASQHLAPELGALDRNRSLIEYGTRVAAESGADWVLSGELVVPGYRFEPLIGTNWIAEQPDSWMGRLARLSSDLGVASFVSHPERETLTGKLFNSLFVIGRNGQILGRHRKLEPTPGSEDWSSAGEPGRPILVDGIKTGLLVCADAYKALLALGLRDAGAQLLVSSAAWWPGQWGPKGEWEARTLDTGVPMIVCNRTGCDHDSQLFGSESVVVDRGEKLLTLRATESTVFIVNCQLRQGHIAERELIKSIALKRE